MFSLATMVRPYVSVIITVKDQHESLPLTLIDLDRELSEKEYSYEIIVVSAGETDLSKKALKRFGMFVDHLRYVYLDSSISDRAMRVSGNAAAHGTWRLFLDERVAVPATLFDQAIPLFKDRCDVVTIDRDHTLDLSLDSWLAYFEKFIIDGAVRMYFKSQAGNFLASEFRCFSESAANYIFETGKEVGLAAAVEEVLLAEEAGYTVKALKTVTPKPRPRIPAKEYLTLFLALRRLRARIGRVTKGYASELNNL
jgi:hypothetical protein